MTAPYRPLSLKELNDLHIPEPEWLVDELIVGGTFVLLSAREKSGKGLLTVDLVAAVAEGSDFLGKATKQGAAVYCSTEESIQEVKARFRERVGDSIDLPVYVLPLDGTMNETLDVMNDDCIERLEAMIFEIKPLLVVIDVLREIHSGKEDSSDDMAPVMSRLRSIVRRTGTALVLNHHMSKGGQARGSTSITAGVDSVITLSPSEACNSELGGKLEAKGRSVRRKTFNVTFGENGRWGASGDSSTVRNSPTTSRQRILDHLRATDEPQEAKEIASALAMPEKTARNELRNLSRESAVITSPSGKRGGAHLYNLPPQPSSNAPFLPG